MFQIANEYFLIQYSQTSGEILFLSPLGDEEIKEQRGNMTCLKLFS